MDKIEKTLLSFIILTCVSFALFITYFIITPVTTQKAATKHTIAQNEALETYDYIITSIDSKGYYGKSLNDDTGIFLVKENIKGLQLNIHDSIRVSFPNDSYETITKVEKLN